MHDGALSFFAEDAIFLMFFLAAVLCFVEAFGLLPNFFIVIFQVLRRAIKKGSRSIPLVNRCPLSVTAETPE
jgi:hypothetical protein